MVGSTGKILAGGGNGGTGGKGGTGDAIGVWSNYQWHYVDGQGTPSNNEYYFTGTSQNSIWNGGSVYNANYGIYIVRPYGTAFVYNRGVKDGPEQFQFYHIRRASHSVGTGGTGGAGGVGFGYGQNRTDGSPGGSGTARSGGGGGGGNGGTWGEDGAAGNTGGSGLYYNNNSANNVRAGSAGTAGTAAGKAIVSTSAVQVYGINSPQARALNL